MSLINKRSKILSLFIVLILCFTSLYLKSVSSAEPHIIHGQVFDDIGFGVAFVIIIANNTATSETLNCTTDIFGGYSFELSNYPSGYMNGDVIELNVTIGLFFTNGTVIVDTSEPTQKMDFTLGFTSHVINGHVSRPRGEDARHYSVNVTNEGTGEFNRVLTNSTGHYWFDLVLLDSGYSLGDSITLIVNQSGFQGSNFTSVDTLSSQLVDIHLIDATSPIIHTIIAESQKNISEEIKIVTSITDNYQITSVTIFFKNVGDVFFITSGMVAEDGVIYDWNEDGFYDPNLYGIIISGQPQPGVFEYYIEASDGNQSATSPDSDPENSPYTIDIIDVNPPQINHTPITTMETGMSQNIKAIIWDDIELDNIYLYYTNVGDSIFNNVLMVPAGEENEFNATIPAQFSLGIMGYYITVNDTSNNTARLPSTGNYSIDVTDTLPPEILHVPINSANVGDIINVSAEISDIMDVNSVYLYYTNVTSINDNVSMNRSGNNWSYEIPDQVSTGILYYSIWANDTSDNMASYPINGQGKSVQINDNGTPLITHAPIETYEVFEVINITANVTDNVSVTDVTLCYQNVGDTYYTNLSMVFNVSNGNWSADIPAQGSLNQVKYYINATDGSNNISHPALKPTHNISIIDSTPPILNHTATLSANLGIDINISVNITDNFNVDIVNLYYRAVDNETWNSLSMVSGNNDSRGNGTYAANIPAQSSPGNLSYYVWTNDTSGNNASLPFPYPRANPYIIQVIDNHPPEIVHIPEESIGVNSSLKILVNISDNIVVKTASLHYEGVFDIDFKEINFTRLNKWNFEATIPAQDHSGNISYNITASDGLNINQSTMYNVPVINHLPDIIHANKSYTEAGMPFSIVAQITDDLQVTNAEVHWRLIGGSTFNTIIMMDNQWSEGWYRADIGTFTPTTIEYYLTASDAEGFVQKPSESDTQNIFKVQVKDISPPVIEHILITSLNITTFPIISARVTDNLNVVNVTLHYKNSTMDNYANIDLGLVDGTSIDGNYTIVIEMQTEGEFRYYISAFDRYNYARSPEQGYYNVTVVNPPSIDTTDDLLLGLLIVLMIIAIILICFSFYRKQKRKINQKTHDSEITHKGEEPDSDA